MKFCCQILRIIFPFILLASVLFSGCSKPYISVNQFSSNSTQGSTVPVSIPAPTFDKSSESTIPTTNAPVTEPPVTEPPVTEPPVTVPPVTEPPVTEPPVTEPPVTEPPATEPNESKIPFLDHRQVSFHVTVMTPQLTVYSGPGAEYEQVAVISYGRYLKITELHGSLDTLWGCFYGGWICMDYTDFYVSSSIYQSYIASMDIFNNSISQALPLTIVHKLVLDHFNSPLPDNKTVKKALIIGYDGFRTDGLEMVKNLSNSAVMHLSEQGGLYHAFTGGISGYNEQLTVSAPSWVAATTGGWADYNGVTDNAIPKNNVSTFITELAEQGKNAAVVVSWPNDVQIAYQPDIDYATQNNLPIQYILNDSDDGTFNTVLSLLQNAHENTEESAMNPDVLFCVFEQTDAAGHAGGYGNYKETYIDACQSVDSNCFALIKSIEERSTYDQEDWLIIITTDHGGVANGHGSQMTFDRMIWLACNKEIPLIDENLNYALIP